MGMVRSWKPSGFGEVIRDSNHELYYRGEKVNKAVYRGNVVWNTTNSCSFIAVGRSYAGSMLLATSSPSGSASPTIVGTNLKLKVNNSPVVTIIGTSLFRGTSFTSNTSDIDMTRYIMRGYNRITVWGDSFSSFKLTGLLVPRIITPIPKGASSITSMSRAFMGCGLSLIPKNLLKNLPDVTEFDYVFSGCNFSELPNDLFYSQSKVKTFEGAFQGNYRLKNIPATLFQANHDATNFDHTFFDCRSLEHIPTGLFQGMTKAVSFWRTFMGCGSIKSVPNIFQGCTVATNFQQTFQNCSSIVDIGNNLFSDCGLDANFDSTFSSCTALEEIPNGLFDSAEEARSYRDTFLDCSSLKAIPENLFVKQKRAVIFLRTFSGCTSLKTLPSRMFPTDAPQRGGGHYKFSSTFAYCTGLESIPNSFFEGVYAMGGSDPSGTYEASGYEFYKTFIGCSSLKAVPSRLFANLRSYPTDKYGFPYNTRSTLRIRLYNVFENCTSLHSISSDIFADNIDALSAFTVFSLNALFKGCSELTDIPDGLFSPLQHCHFDHTFENCSSLQSLPAKEAFINPVFWAFYIQGQSGYDGTSISECLSFTECFAGCSEIVSIVPDFWNITSTGGYKPIGDQCFSGCTNAANYAEIPDDWK